MEPVGPGSRNATIDTILGRCSIRRGYVDRPVPRSMVETVLACGMSAPSSKNAQPWRFHVFADPAVLRDIADEMRTSPERHAYVPHDPVTGRPRAEYQSTVVDSADVLASAPCAIFIENLGAFSRGRRTLLAVPTEALAASLAGYAFELVGVGAALANMWIAANSLGLAAAFMGDVVIAEESLRPRLDLVGDLIGVFIMGFSDQPPTPPMDTRSLPQHDRIVWH